MCGHALGLPPGIKDGPYLAPSSPPLTPLPTKRIPFSSRSLILSHDSQANEGDICHPKIVQNSIRKKKQSPIFLSSHLRFLFNIYISFLKRKITYNFSHTNLSNLRSCDVPNFPWEH
ncbi:hypothetical protein PUN28_000849 [Cardiocondyla obscurior]|uniref:Uncharacterized protein n=1 Tax=Cardiocondyla obscurior TaxID=286306 RepID=A0AAW2H1H2_9HYME